MAEKRVISFLKQLKEWLIYNPGNIAISCHKNSMRVIVRYFEKLTVKEMLQKEFLQNKAKTYTLSFSNLNEKSSKKIKPVWRGKVISQKVKLASDPNNILKLFY
jgi:bisphosphoglycerate-dependent phosphoglycerate mutase